MKLKNIILSILLLVFFNALGQEKLNVTIFKNESINFGGKQTKDSEIKVLQGGRIIYKKVVVPEFVKGTDVNIKLKLRSNGDRWDKSGSCFVVSHPDQISIIDVSNDKKTFPEASVINKKYKGVLSTKDYKPAIEILRFMTPFGVGFYSDNKDRNRRPVYIPKWEKEVVWEQDISHLSSLTAGTFYVGVWIDTWTKEGYSVDLSLTYSNRPLKKLKVIPFINTIPYVNGQYLPDFFAETVLNHNFQLPKDIKNVKLYYTTTGHGGHSGGDEFIKIKNSVFLDNKLVIDTIPWRDDCASFRRFNPTSGVWLKKDSASYIDLKAKAYKVKEIEERIASSDLSRSNWCPGSSVKPIIKDLGNLKAGDHFFKISIPATKAAENKFNHWLISAYIIYED